MSDHDTEAAPTDREILQGIGRELEAANRRLETIKNCLVFFVIVTMIGWLALIVAAAQND
jgi:hypothetical protein